MTQRKRSRTLDSNSALEVLSAAGGNLREADLASLRNDLPMDDETGTVEASPEDNLRSIVNEVSGSDGEQGFVSIWKMGEQTKKMEYVTRCPAQDFLSDGGPDFLAKNFGPGDYEIRVYTSDSRIVKRPRLVISKAAAAFAQRGNGQNNSGGNADIASLAKVMAEGFAQLGGMLAQNRAPVETRAQMLDDLVKMKTIFGNGGAQQLDPLDMFSKMTTIFKSMQPRGEGEGNVFMELLDKFSPVIVEAMQNNRGTPALPNPDAPVAAISPPVTPAGVALTPEQQGAQKMSLQLKMQLLYLCTQAARDSDPEPFAAIICNDVPREALDALINDPNWIDALSKFHPAVKQHADWFNELRDAVTDELIERDRPDLPDPENDAISTESENGEANFVPESDDGINRNT